MKKQPAQKHPAKKHPGKRLIAPPSLLADPRYLNTKAPPAKKQNRNEVTVEVPSSTLGVKAKLEALVPLGGESLRSMRHTAGLRFIFDREKRTVGWWWTNHYSKAIALVRFKSWSSQDKWIARRQEQWREIEAVAARNLASAHVRVLQKDLEALDQIQGSLASALVGNGLQEIEINGKKEKVLIVPHGFESRAEALRVLTLLDKRRDEKRREVMGGLPAGGTGMEASAEDSELIPGVSPKVAEALARAYLQATAEEQEKGIVDAELVE